MANLSNINNKFLVTTGGNVGINVTSPGAKLDVDGDVYVRNGHALYLDTLAGYSSAVVSLNASTNFIVPSGSVGIGAAPLQGKLDILNNGDYDAHTGHGLAINSSASNAFTSMYMGADDSIDAAYIQSAGRNTSFTSKKLLLNPNGGNVGIGTTTPDHKLRVNGDARLGNLHIKTSDFGVGGTGKTIYADGAGSGVLGFISTTAFDFSNGSTSRVRIDSSGNVGIGNTSPSNFLSWQKQLVVGSGSADVGITIYHGSGSGNQGAIVFADGNTGTDRYRGSISYNGADEMKFFTSTTERMRIESDGQVSLRTAGAHLMFQNTVGTAPYIANAGTGYADLTIATGGSERMRITSVGNIGISGDTSAWSLGKTIQINSNYGAINYNGVSAILGIVNAYYNGSGYIRQNVGYAASIDFNTAISGGGLAFRTENSTGAAGDTILLTTKVAILSNGRVGIGVTGPSAPLEIAAESTNVGNTLLSIGNAIVNPNTRDSWIKMFGSQATVDKTFAVGNMYGKFVVNYLGTRATNPESGGTKMFTVDGSTGNVGIGVDPSGNTDRLQIDNPANPTSIRIGDNTTDDCYVVFNTDGNDWSIGTDRSDSNKFKISDYSRVGTNDRLVIDGSGNVGIGTTSPDYKLDVETTSDIGAGVYIQAGKSSQGEIQNTGLIIGSRTDVVNGDYIGVSFSGNAAVPGRARAAIGAVATSGPSAMDLVFMTRNAGDGSQLGTGDEKMRITSAGNVLISKTSAGSVLTKGVELRDEGNIFACTNVANTSSYFSNIATSGTRELIRFYAGTAQVGSINSNGTTTAYNTTSDYRLKEDLQDFAGLDMVSKIPVYDFKWKSDESRSYGVMAHELQEVLPDAVSGEKDAEEMQGVDYSKIVPLLVKSIQELEAKIKILENK